MKAFFKWMGVILLLAVMISCQFDNGETEDVFYKKVSISINEPGRSNSFTGAPPRLEALTSSTSVVLAFPSGVTAVDQSLDFNTAFDRQLFDTTDNTVSLLVPIDTPMQLVKANYGSVITLAVFDLQSTPPLATGLSDEFTISGGTTEKAITVTMSLQAAFTVVSTLPANEATNVSPTTSISIIFSEAMATSGISLGSSSACDSHIRVSSDDFSTCVAMSASTPTYSNSDQTLTFSPAAPLSVSTTYKIRVSSDTQNASAENMGYTYISTTGFTTGSTLLIGGDVQTQALSLSGTVTAFAGSGVSGYNNATSTAAQFAEPYGMTTDGTNLFVTEYLNHAIRKIVISTQAVTLVAGSETGTNGFNDAVGNAALFDAPAAVTTNGNGMLWIADSLNNRIRQIDLSSNTVSTLAGGTDTGGDEVQCSAPNNANCYDGTGGYARFFAPYGIVYYNGFLYVADRDNNRIRKINATSGLVTTLSGLGSAGFFDGSNTTTEFSSPTSVATNGFFLFVADMNNTRIRKVDISSGSTTTIAGTASIAVLNYPRGVSIDGTNVYISEAAGGGDNRIRRSTISGTPGSDEVTLAGGAKGCAGGLFNTPKGMASTASAVFIASADCHQIFKIE